MFRLEYYSDYICNELVQGFFIIGPEGSRIGFISEDGDNSFPASLSDAEKKALIAHANEQFEKNRNDWKINKRLKAIEEKDCFEDIEIRAKEIARILGDDYDESKHLLLADTLNEQNNDKLELGIRLQLLLHCSQEQAAEICRLF